MSVQEADFIEPVYDGENLSGWLYIKLHPDLGGKRREPNRSERRAAKKEQRNKNRRKIGR